MQTSPPFRDIRQVPDTQEVFLSPNSGISIIIEVLKSVSAADLREAAGYVCLSLLSLHSPLTVSYNLAVYILTHWRTTTMRSPKMFIG